MQKLLGPVQILLDPEGGSQKATLVVLVVDLVVVVISSLKIQKIPKAFLIRAERNETLHTHSC